jgi:hypothetical protein
MTHTIKEIVRHGTGNMTHVCEGKVYYEIEIPNLTSDPEKKGAAYQLEIDSTTDEWKGTYLYPKFKAITLMRWIRKGIENGNFIQIK